MFRNKCNQVPKTLIVTPALMHFVASAELIRGQVKKSFAPETVDSGLISGLVKPNTA